MQPIRTDQATGTYVAPDGLEEKVGGLPFWRDRVDGLPTILSVWSLSADEREAIALGGNVLLRIVGEPIPPVAIEVLSPIDVPYAGMDPDPRYEGFGDDFVDHHDGGLFLPVVVLVGLGTIAVLLTLGFLLGRATV